NVGGGEAPVLSGFRDPNSEVTGVDEPHYVLPRDPEESGGLLGGELLAAAHHRHGVTPKEVRDDGAQRLHHRGREGRGHAADRGRHGAFALEDGGEIGEDRTGWRARLFRSHAMSLGDSTPTHIAFWCRNG